MGGGLSLSPLRRALASLREGLGHEYTEMHRDACIQRFEFSYELTWKTLRRFLSEFAGAEERLTIPSIYRRAAREELLPSPVSSWMDYHRARNESSHVYDEGAARRVYESAALFLADAERLTDAMAARMNDDEAE